MLVGALASGINAVAGGGSLISFPVLNIGFQIPSVEANATNSVSLWPGSIGSIFGFWALIKKTRRYFWVLIGPTLVGSALGAFLLTVTDQKVFDFIVPFLILLAATLLWFQPQIKRFALGEHRTLPMSVGVLIQFLVALYGGYFGAGMGIMMLAAFALYIEGTIHELNAVKVWLGLFINLVASVVFLFDGLIQLWPAVALTIGAIVGGYGAAVVSQRVDSEKMRVAISVYGFIMAGYFFLTLFRATGK